MEIFAGKAGGGIGRENGGKEQEGKGKEGVLSLCMTVVI